MLLTLAEKVQKMKPVQLFACMIIWFDSLGPSQQFFSYVGTGLPRLNQY